MQQSAAQIDAFSRGLKAMLLDDIAQAEHLSTVDYKNNPFAQNQIMGLTKLYLGIMPYQMFKAALHNQDGQGHEFPDPQDLSSFADLAEWAAKGTDAWGLAQTERVYSESYRGTAEDTIISKTVEIMRSQTPLLKASQGFHAKLDSAAPALSPMPTIPVVPQLVPAKPLVTPLPYTAPAPIGQRKTLYPLPGTVPYSGPKLT